MIITDIVQDSCYFLISYDTLFLEPQSHVICVEHPYLQP